ncbi:MAG: hypothetical protein B6I20_12370 [Bacteroidetes bacterium 4572_117]|nr:MAG: hypothetical protein B6I20_12370 [Bacteroidetes bacterium 4572_117]
MLRTIKVTVFFILLSFLSTICALSQKKNIRLNLGFQVNLPERVLNSEIQNFNNKNGGFGFHITPKFNYSDKLSYAINMEYSIVTENYQTDNIGSFHILSFSPAVNYSFTNFKIRPFIGIGVGCYHVIFHKPQINIGVRPIIGVSIYDYFDLSFEYNKIIADINVNPDVNGDFDNYYIAIKASFSIGLFNTTITKNSQKRS